MKITATDFQLRVNKYFTKLIQGEEVIIERYGKEFAVLVPIEWYKSVITKESEVVNGNSKNSKNLIKHEFNLKKLKISSFRTKIVSRKGKYVYKIYSEKPRLNTKINQSDSNLMISALTEQELIKLLKLFLAKI